MFNITTQNIDKISTLPVIGTVIGCSTILFNTAKLASDVSRILWNKIGNLFSKNTEGNTANIQTAKNDASNHLSFIARGIIRAIPVLGGASLWIYNAKQVKVPASIVKEEILNVPATIVKEEILNVPAPIVKEEIIDIPAPTTPTPAQRAQKRAAAAAARKLELSPKK